MTVTSQTMAHPGRRIVTLGEAMLRLTAPAGERLQSSVELHSYVAGSEANVARTVARLGAPSVWLSALPESPIGERIVRELNADGVDTSFVQRTAEGRVGVFYAEQGPPPRGARVWYDRADSTFSRMSAFDEQALKGAGFAVVSGITPALGDRSRTVAETFASQARASGARVCVDVNYRSLLWTPEGARAGLAGLLRTADIVVCSARDARIVFGAHGDAAEVAELLVGRWAPEASIVVVTRGEAGSALVSRGKVIEQAAEQAVVLDRFGVGDAFLSGLLWALWRGAKDEEALRCAGMLAALKCTLLGDVASIGAAELELALAGEHEAAILR